MIITDSDLEYRLIKFLQYQKLPGVESLTIQADQGRLLVAGALPSAAARRWCVEACRHVPGVVCVTEQLTAVL